MHVPSESSELVTKSHFITLYYRFIQTSYGDFNKQNKFVVLNEFLSLNVYFISKTHNSFIKYLHHKPKTIVKSYTLTKYKVCVVCH